MKFWGCKTFLRSCLLIVSAILSISFKAECSGRFFESLNAQNWLQAYEAIDMQINSGQGYASCLDTIGYLSWRESRILESYLNVYRATGDVKWIEKFICQADLVLIHRDDFLWGGDTYLEQFEVFEEGLEVSQASFGE